MRAGKLDTVIIVERCDFVSDDYGGTTWICAPIATLRAQVIQQNTEEFMRGWGQTSDTITVFRTRWHDDLQITDRIIFNGVAMAIVEVKPLGRRRGLELRCKVGRQDGSRPES